MSDRNIYGIIERGPRGPEGQATDLTAITGRVTALETTIATVASDSELAAAVASLTTAIDLKQNASTAATDTELAALEADVDAGVAALQALVDALPTDSDVASAISDAIATHASGDASDAELAAAVALEVTNRDSAIASAIAAHAAGDATDAELAAAIASEVSSRNTAISTAVASEASLRTAADDALAARLVLFEPVTPTGNVTTDTAAVEAAIVSGRPISGAFVVNASLGYSDRCLTMIENGLLLGYGSGRSSITLANGVNKDLIRSTNFGVLTGTSSGTSNLDSMPHSFAIRGVKLRGNFLNNTSGGGIAVVGYDFALDDVDVAEFRGIGIYTEQLIPWTEDLTVDPESAGPKSYWDRVVAHKCVSGGIYFNGPSDSVWSGVYAYLNGPVDASGEQLTSPASTTAGIKLGSGANGLLADKCHSWGRNQKYAWEISGGSAVIITDSQAEGAQTSQVRVMTSDFQWLNGHVYTGEDFRSATGFEVGDGSYYAASVVIESRCTNCEGGAVNERSGDTNRYVVWGYQGAGDIFPSALHTKTVFDASGLLGGRPLGHAEGRQTPTYAGSTPGTTGQLLTRDTALDAGAKWADAPAPPPTELNAQTGTTYTLVLADANRLVERFNASAMTTTVPPNSSVAFPIGTEITVVRGNSGGTMTFAAGAGVTIRSAGGLLGLRVDNSLATLIKRNTDDWYLVGDLV